MLGVDDYISKTLNLGSFWKNSVYNGFVYNSLPNIFGC